MGFGSLLKVGFEPELEDLLLGMLATASWTLKSTCSTIRPVDIASFSLIKRALIYEYFKTLIK